MNCRTFRKRQIELLDINPDPSTASDLLRHVETCPECARELAETRALLTALSPTQSRRRESNLKERIMNRVTELESVENTRRSRGWLPRLSFAAVTLVVIGLLGGWLVNHGRSGSAFTILAQAAEASERLATIHIVAHMRTAEHDNFDMIVPEGDLVPVELWKVSGETAKWRIEKRGRVAVMDGSEIVMLTGTGESNPMAVKFSPGAGIAQWLAPLLDVNSLFVHEQEVAREQGARVEIESKGPTTVLTIQAAAQGDYSESDYRKNKSIMESDNVRAYTFDSRTHRLLGLQVYVNTGKDNVLVFETDKVEYDSPLSAGLFQLDVPEGAIWYKSPDQIRGTADNSSLTPKQAAEAIFKGMADEDWDSLRGFAGTMMDDPKIRDYVGGLQIISIGEPFKSGAYPGWFVPYEIRFKSGDVKKMNLAIRNDNEKKQWTLDGGI